MGGAKSDPALFAIARQAGFTQQSFDACINDKVLLNKIQQVWNTASSKFQVDSTPTFFINGERHPGSMSIEEIDKIIAPLIKS
jgi:protein-disulfide isomerase